MTKCIYCGREIHFIPDLGVWLLNYTSWVDAVDKDAMEALYVCSPAGPHEPPSRDAVVHDIARVLWS